MNKIWVVIRKEWAEVFKNRFVLFTVAFLPLILTALPLITLGMSGSSGDLGDISETDLPNEFSQLCSGLSGEDCTQYFLVSQFLL